MQYTCVCGASYKHQSNLSRHQTGNSRQGILPCVVYLKKEADSLKKTERAIVEKYDVEKYELSKDIQAFRRSVDKLTESVLKLEEYSKAKQLTSVCDIQEYRLGHIPEFAKAELFVPILPLVGESLEKRTSELSGKNQIANLIINRVFKAFELIHLNKKHPEYWNVVLQNIKTMRLLVYTEGEWVDEDFRDFVQQHTRVFLSLFVNAVEGGTEEYITFYLGHGYDEHFQVELRERIASALKNPVIRTKIKEFHQMR